MLTIGDSPNDEAMLIPLYFPSRWVWQIFATMQDKMLHLPKYVTHASEFAGFSELAQLLLENSVVDDSMQARQTYSGWDL